MFVLCMLWHKIERFALYVGAFDHCPPSQSDKSFYLKLNYFSTNLANSPFQDALSALALFYEAPRTAMTANGRAATASTPRPPAVGPRRERSHKLSKCELQISFLFQPFWLINKKCLCLMFNYQIQCPKGCKGICESLSLRVAAPARLEATPS